MQVIYSVRALVYLLCLSSMLWENLIILLLQPCPYFVMQRKVLPSLLGSVEVS